MPLNERKIARIITEECKTVEDRCDGYEEELIHTIGEIFTAERQHRIRGMNIQKKINELCKSSAQFLFERQGGSAGGDGSS